MSKASLTADLCVIGAGSAGLSVAAGAAQLGLSTVLFEKGEMGGDCLNFGCVPSKALIAAARHAASLRAGEAFGVSAGPAQINWAKVQAHVRAVISAIAPNDSQERFEGLGVRVVREAAAFVDPRTVESARTRVRAKRFVIATGSRAAIPPIAGLKSVPFLTNESIFDVARLPERLLILGGGAIGVELGQAFRRLGSEVTLIEAAEILGPSDREAAAVVAARLEAEGVAILEGWKAVSVAPDASGVALTIENKAGGARTLVGSHLLVAAGRTPQIDGLGLDAAGVAFDKKGVTTSATLRSVSNRRVWALGDANGRALFTHAAGWHASVWVRNVLFKARTRADAQANPSVVYCEPELAQIGLTEAGARAAHGDRIKIARASFHDNDRAQAMAETEGFCKLVVDKNAKLLGATIVGAEAGELIAALGLAMSQGLSLRALTAPIIAYPTRAEIVKRAASAHYTPLLFSGRTRSLVAILKQFF